MAEPKKTGLGVFDDSEESERKKKQKEDNSSERKKTVKCSTDAIERETKKFRNKYIKRHNVLGSF